MKNESKKNFDLGSLYESETMESKLRPILLSPSSPGRIHRIKTRPQLDKEPSLQNKHSKLSVEPPTKGRPIQGENTGDKKGKKRRWRGGRGKGGVTATGDTTDSRHLDAMFPPWRGEHRWHLERESMSDKATLSRAS